MANEAIAPPPLSRLRERNPLVLNLTNAVVTNFTANALLSLGASPLMAGAPEEIEDLVAIAGAVVLNIGTLDGPQLHAMEIAAKRAAALGRPLVLDPVGVGATPFRRRSVERLLTTGAVRVLRGNASEILALGGETSRAKGVDSGDAVADAVRAARRLSDAYRCVVAVSGPVDQVVSGSRRARLRGGDPLMTKVTGLGCSASALVGAFLGAGLDPFGAGVAALEVNSVAGSIAAAGAAGPGRFAPLYLDALHALSAETLAARGTPDLGLYLVFDAATDSPHGPERLFDAAADAGARVVQIRGKALDDEALLALTKLAVASLRPRGVRVLVNDRVEVARRAEADGVHLGAGDEAWTSARQRLGARALIGVSVESLDEARALEEADIDYLGVSAIFPTPTKGDLRTLWGLEGLRRLRAESSHRLVAIGGLDESNAFEVARSGADGLAFVSAFARAPDPRSKGENLRRLIVRGFASRNGGVA